VCPGDKKVNPVLGNSNERNKVGVDDSQVPSFVSLELPPVYVTNKCSLIYCNNYPGIILSLELE